jgi:hypothetical protein
VAQIGLRGKCPALNGRILSMSIHRLRGDCSPAPTGAVSLPPVARNPGEGSRGNDMIQSRDAIDIENHLYLYVSLS